MHAWVGNGVVLRNHVPASAVILEITETTIIRNFEACKQFVEELRALGLGVSIDDFGAGFTSLAYLGSLAVTELKLDRTFLTDLTAHGNERGVQLVRGTIELAHALGLVVVAEGIEICATLELLALLGCGLHSADGVVGCVARCQSSERPRAAGE